jgi:hypothetical protein
MNVLPIPSTAELLLKLAAAEAGNRKLARENFRQQNLINHQQHQLDSYSRQIAHLVGLCMGKRAGSVG